MAATATQEREALAMVDLTQRPSLYRTNNPKHYGRICIDFQPESVPTVASFASTKDAFGWMVSRFGLEQVETWFGKESCSDI